MCWKCGKETDFSVQVYRSSVCPSCGADLHSCRACRFYSPDSHFGCSETVDELVSDKERANFCDFFSYGKNARYTGEGASADDAASKARNAFNALFS